MAGRKTIVFDDFSKGEYGSLGNGNLGKGWWTGQNLMRGVDGTLFPRAGEKPYVLTGAPNGTIAGMGESGGKIWFAVGTAVYSFDSGVFTSQAVTAYTGALPGGVTEPLTSVTYNNKSYVTTYPNGVYVLDHTAHTVASVAGSPNIFNCTIYGSRMVGAGSNRLYFSDAGDFTSWPAANYIDIGESTNIVVVRTVRSSLAIGKSNGVWYLLSGVPGVNDVVRQVTSAPTPPHHEMSVDTGASGVGFVSDQSFTVATFTGAAVVPLPHLQVQSALTSGIPSQIMAFRLRNPGEWGVVVDNGADEYDTTAGSIWLFRNGAWTRHRRAIVAAIEGGWVASTTKHDWIVMGQGGSPSLPPTFSAWNPYLNRPPFVSDTATIIDPSLVTFALPEWHDPTGEDVAVRGVVVDFTKWATADSGANGFSVQATTMRVDDNNPEVTGNTFDWTEAPSAASAAGTKARITAPFDSDYGNGFRLSFTNLRGVSISRITVVLDTRPPIGFGGE